MRSNLGLTLFLLAIAWILSLSAAVYGGYRYAAAREFIPPFARVPFEPFARDAAAAIALREWRMFGSMALFEDMPPPAADKTERLASMWQRVGEYFWLGLDEGSPLRGSTGIHNEYGRRFKEKNDGRFAWSAAFISYLMRMAGAGSCFPYSQSHSYYIQQALKANAEEALAGWCVRAKDPALYAPQVGDLVCQGRNSAVKFRFDTLPSTTFDSHCDIVVRKTSERLTVVGGNLNDGIVRVEVPINAEGILSDTSKPWLAVIQVLYAK